MLRIAVDHAKLRLAKAISALDKYEATEVLTERKSHWSDFLLATSGVYSKLEQGAKSNGSSNGWFGRIKKERKDDPLLRYMHHARNSDEHGISDVARRRPRSAGIMIGDKMIVDFTDTSREHDLDEDFTLTSWGGPPGHPQPRLVKIEPRMELTTVTDIRFGDSFDPPKEHLGQPLSDETPLAVGKLLLAYLGRILQEAEWRVTD